MLPMKWQALLALDDNKVDLARFLSDTGSQRKLPADTTIIVSDGCLIEGDILYLYCGLDVAVVRSNKEEADVTFVLNEVIQNSHVDNEVVSS